MDDFNCGFFSKVTCAFLLQENKGIIRIKHLKTEKKERYLRYYWSNKGFMGTVVNRAVPSLHVWSIEIALSVTFFKDFLCYFSCRFYHYLLKNVLFNKIWNSCKIQLEFMCSITFKIQLEYMYSITFKIQLEYMYSIIFKIQLEYMYSITFKIQLEYMYSITFKYN